nr:hypothetical protein [Brevundimonas sp.]
MRLKAISAGMATAALAAPVFAMDLASPQQAVADPWRVERERPTTVSDLISRIDRDSRFYEGPRGFGDGAEWAGFDPARNLSSTWAADNRDIWYEG